MSDTNNTPFSIREELRKIDALDFNGLSLAYLFLLQLKGWLQLSHLDGKTTMDQVILDLTIDTNLYPEWLQIGFKKLFAKEREDVAFDNPDQSGVGRIDKTPSVLSEINTNDYTDIYNVFQEYISQSNFTDNTSLFYDVYREMVSSTTNTELPLNLPNFIYGLVGDVGAADIYIPSIMNINMILDAPVGTNIIAQGKSFLSLMGMIAANKYVLEKDVSYADFRNDWVDTQLFDYIIADDAMDSLEDLKLFIDNGLASLKPNGKILVTDIHDQFTNQSDDLWNTLIKNGQISKVIAIDSDPRTNLYLYEIVPMAQAVKHVSFIDIRRFVRSQYIDLSVIEKIKASVDEDYFLRKVHVNYLLQQKYLFSFSNYLYIEYPEGNPVALQNYCAIPETIARPRINKLPMLSSLDLKTTAIDACIQYERLKKINANYFEDKRVMDMERIEDDYVFIVLDTDGNLYPRILDKSYKKAWVFNTVTNARDITSLFLLDYHVVALRIDTSKVNVEYLLHELNKEYVQSQVKFAIQGKEQAVLSIADVMQLKLIVPDLKTQVLIVEELKSLTADIAKLVRKREELLTQHKTTSYNDIESLHHTLGLPKQRILSTATLLGNFVKKHATDLEELNKLFYCRTNNNILDSINSIKNDMSYISELFSKSINELDINKFQFENIDIIKIIEYFKKIDIANAYYKLELNYTDLVDNSLNLVYTNLELLKIVIDNILSNAQKYAFDKKGDNNKVVIRLYTKAIEIENSPSSYKNLLYIEIKNNGKPFPPNFTKDKFVTKFATSNKLKSTGIGGYDIGRILDLFTEKLNKAFEYPFTKAEDYFFWGAKPNTTKEISNFEWDLDINSDPSYPVCFRFGILIDNSEDYVML